MTTLVTLVTLGIYCQQIVVVQALEVQAVQKQKQHSSRSQNELTENFDFDRVWELMYEDLMRWLAIFEDVLAESLREQFFDGIVDRKTVKRALRFFAQNLLASMKTSGFLERFISMDVTGNKKKKHDINHNHDHK